MKTFLPFFAFVALISTASARLGETEKELQARYGGAFPADRRPNDPPGVTRLEFSFKNYTIIVAMMDGKCVSEIIGTTNGDNISMEEAKAFLDANGGLAAWHSTGPVENGSVTMARGDDALATYSEKRFYIRTAAFAGAYNANAKARKESKAAGF